ncbi:MAG: hypothetical protein CMK74_03560 [Pseudomonadales bacterium]|nr:hypothetical protein [Pseudomonadales bacterium]|tara:strand:+ start:563 stop:1225 length:663 start_codon:yes stop_codon:yes gene_type:complete
MGAVERSENLYESGVSEKDEALLHRIYREVNRCHYSGKIDIPVRWEIPSASEAPEPPPKLSTLTAQEMKRIVLAVKAYETHDFDSAKKLILPFTGIGVTDADQLYIRILMAANDPSWSDVARKINKVSSDTLYVPAASTEVVDRVEVIYVHPALSKSAGYNAPRYVLRYVLFHEFLHKFLNTSPDDPHPELFRRMEKAVPERAKAIEWLQAHHFSTVEDQ